MLAWTYSLEQQNDFMVAHNRIQFDLQNSWFEKKPLQSETISKPFFARYTKIKKKKFFVLIIN